MTERPDLRDLIGDDVAPEELGRLRRTHELLLSADPPPELPPVLGRPPRAAARGRGGGVSWFVQNRVRATVVLAGAAAAAAFAIGFLTGRTSDGGFKARAAIGMHGTALAPNATASIEVGSRDSAGNMPMLVEVTGLPKLPARSYYELYLTRHHKPALSCGTFTTAGRVTVPLSVPYRMKGYDGWIVTRESWKSRHPGPVVMTTF